MRLSAEEKFRIKKAAFREVAIVLADALECDGFKHRNVPEVAEENYDKADDLFFKEVELIVKALRTHGKVAGE